MSYQKGDTVVIDGITCIVVPFESLDADWQRIHDDNWPFGCKCGESHSTAHSASTCRKCRQYLEDEDNDGTVYYTPKQKGAA